MPKLETRPLSWFKSDPKQPRKHFDEAELRLLGESLRRKQLQPILASPDGTIRVGERRYRAALLVGMKELMVIITDEALTEAEIRAIQLTENIHRADLTAHEKWQACAELMCMNPGWQQKDLAEHLHLDPSSVTRLLSPSKCSGEWQEALKAGKVGISDCYAASKLAESEQSGLLALKLGGASRDTLEQAGRKQRHQANGHTEPSVKTAKVKIPVATDAATGQVTVAGSPGEEIDLEGTETILKEALKAVRSAKEKGLSVKSAVAVWRDVAAAG